MDIKLVREKMDSSLKFFEKELVSVRTSRANPSMLDYISIDAYGSKTPLNQLGNVSAPDSSTLTIQVWDMSLVKIIEKTILESNLGINPQTEGQLIRLPIPKLSEERRSELAKLVSQYGEQAKIALRNNRRDFMDKVKKEEKEKIISQDDLKKNINEIQKITDEYIAKIDSLTLTKQEEILKV